MLAATAILAGTFSLIGDAHAQLSQSFQSACPGSQSSARWCPGQISKEGWALKYKTESPQDLMDVYYRYEVWTREKLAVVCVQRSARGGGRVNSCTELNEVQQ